MEGNLEHKKNITIQDYTKVGLTLRSVYMEMILIFSPIMTALNPSITLNHDLKYNELLIKKE